MPDADDTIATCNTCGAALAPGTLNGLCPRCLLLTAMADEAGTNLHIRCPQCHTAIEIVDDASLKEVTCPSCDSRFSLIGDATVTTGTAAPPEVGRFELFERVGIGTFGSVWKARDPELDRIVAVKIPRSEQLAEDETERFLQEARLAARLQHPGIVSVHEVGRDGDRVYIVSDFVEGVTLADSLSAGSPTFQAAAELCAVIADALEHAHVNGVIHRDLKPSNVMLDDERRPHVLDFGLAKRDATEVTVTADGRVLGTPAYMSPEQARGEAHLADARSDVYSLGVMLFEMLTGEKPFRGTSRMLLHQVLSEDAPRPQSLNSRVPRDLETICLKCLEKDPQRRYQTAKDLADELRRFLAGKPIHARPISRFNRGWRWCRRNPAIAGLSGLLAASLIIGTCASTYFAIEESRRADSEYAARVYAGGRELEARRARDAERDARLDAERQTDVARRTAYGLQLARAQYQRLQDPALAKRLLNDETLCPKELRDFGWRHLHAAVSLDVAVFDAVDVIHFNSDGSQATYLTSDRSRIASHDLATGDETTLFQVEDEGECIVTFSAQLNRVVTSDRATWHKQRFQKAPWLRTWDLPSGELLATFEAINDPIDRMLLSADGRFLAIRIGNEVAVHDVDSLDETLALTNLTTSFPEFAFLPDSSSVAATAPQGVELTDIATGVRRQLVPVETGDVSFIAFSPDGKTMATGGREVQIWDVESATLTTTLREDVGTNYPAAVFSPDGQTLAVESSEFPIALWDLRASRKWATLSGSHSTRPLAFSPDGGLLASGGKKVWRVPQQGDSADDLPTGPQAMITLWGNDTLVAGIEGAPQFWDTATGQRMTPLDLGETYCHAASPDGSLLAVADRDHIHVYRGEDREQVLAVPEEMAYRIVFSPDNRLMAATPINTQFIDLWSVATGEKLARLDGRELAVVSLAFSPDGRTLAAGMGFQPAPENPIGRVDIWDVEQQTITKTLKGFQYGVYAVAFSPDGKSLAAASQRIKVWDVRDWSERFTIEGHENIVWNVAYSPDGSTLASGSFDGTVKLWDPITGHERLTLGSHGYWVTGLVFSPDGSLLATSSTDGVKLWHGD